MLESSASMVKSAIAPQHHDNSLNVLPPPLKWAGGKRWQLPHLKEYWERECHRRLVEPFCGGLAVTLGLTPQRALLNDINPHLINFYLWLKRGLNISIKMRTNHAHFYKRRKRFNELLRTGKAATKEAASLFYYLNRTGYNGMCRFNGSGEFNVPIGSYQKVKYKRDFSAYKALFTNWQFSNRSFQYVELEPGDFVYADPPYDVEFTHYWKKGFSWEDQVRTAQWLATHRGPVILSNIATLQIVRLYKGLGYEIIRRSAPRRISCNGDRRDVKEVLAIRNL